MKEFLFNAFLFWISVSRKYDVLKENPVQRKNSTRLGVTSLIMSIAGMICTVGFAFLTYLCFTGMDGAGLAGIFILIGGIICAAASLAFFVDLVLAGLVYAIYQMKLNRRPIGLVALIVSLVLILGTVAVVIIGVTAL